MTELLANLVSAVCTPEELVLINKAFDLVEAKMTYLISLTDDEVKSLLKLHEGNRPFCETVLIEMQLWKGSMSAQLSAIELEKDLNFTKVMPDVMTRSAKIARLIQCTYLRSGAEAVNMALKFRDFLIYQSSLGDAESQIAKAALARIDLHFEAQKIKAANTRNNKLLQKTDAASTPPDKTA